MTDVAPSPAIAAAIAACAAETRREAKNFYYAFRLLPEAERAAMYALYSFCRRADDIVDEPGEVEAKRSTLAAFREGLDACFEGAPEGDIYVALAWTRERYGITKRHLEHVIDGCEMDLDTTRYATWEDLKVYLDAVASAVGRSTMEVFGIDPKERSDYADAGGWSVQLTNILRDVKEDYERDRVYLPQEDLERFGVAEEELGGDRVSDGFRALMRFEVDRARTLYLDAREALPESERRRVLPLTAISRIYERVLDRIERQGYDVFTQRASLPGWQKAMVGVGTMVRAKLHLRIGR